MVISDKCYEMSKSKFWWFGEKMISMEVCMVYVLELDEMEGLKLVFIK